MKKPIVEFICNIIRGVYLFMLHLVFFLAFFVEGFNWIEIHCANNTSVDWDIYFDINNFVLFLCIILGLEILSNVFLSRFTSEEFQNEKNKFFIFLTIGLIVFPVLNSMILMLFLKRLLDYGGCFFWVWKIGLILWLVYSIHIVIDSFEDSFKSLKTKLEAEKSEPGIESDQNK